MSALDVEAFRERLLEERGRVLAAIDYLQKENPGTEEEAEPAAGNHLAESASITLGREIDYTLEENASHVLSEIEAALGRLDGGTFGICQRCGNPIAEERLEALPWATLCIDCKRKEERG